MRILLGNDDGYRAEGLRALQRALAPRHEVLVCAPAGECSATGHGLTLRDPLRIHHHKENGTVFHGLTGLPADAAKFGLAVLCADAPPDLLISGINHGANTGQNLFYSGTVAAACEGTFSGIPSMAVSLCIPPGPAPEGAFQQAAQLVAQLVEKFQHAPLDPEILLNVNIPHLPLEQIKGLRVSRMGYARFHEVFQHRHDPGGRAYWWMDGSKNGDDTDPEHDDFQVHNGWISLTPLKLDLSHPRWEQALESWDLESFKVGEA